MGKSLKQKMVVMIAGVIPMVHLHVQGDTAYRKVGSKYDNGIHN